MCVEFLMCFELTGSLWDSWTPCRLLMTLLACEVEEVIWHEMSSPDTAIVWWNDIIKPKTGRGGAVWQLGR